MSRNKYSYENRMFINNVRCSIILGERKSLEPKDKKVGVYFKKLN
jgi:hypothetical protein